MEEGLATIHALCARLRDGVHPLFAILLGTDLEHQQMRLAHWLGVAAGLGEEAQGTGNARALDRHAGRALVVGAGKSEHEAVDAGFLVLGTREIESVTLSLTLSLSRQ